MQVPEPPKGVIRDVIPDLPKGGVWGVRDYHTILQKRAIAGAVMSWGYVGMVLAATVMATAGLLINSPAAVIGAMCVAPFMAPSRAVCIGALFGDRKVFFGGLAKQFLGLLVIGVIVAMAITALLNRYLDGITITHEILLRSMPTTRDVVLSTLIALSAGVAASLALVAQPHIVETSWGQIIDAIIGVEIAISLVPPASVIGIGLALGTPEHSLNAFYLLLLNIIALDLFGSSLILYFWGVRRVNLDLEKNIRSAVAFTLDLVPGFISVRSTVHVTLIGHHEALIDVILRRRFGGVVPENLATQIANDVRQKTSCRCNVTVQVIPMLLHSEFPEVS